MNEIELQLRASALREKQFQRNLAKQQHRTLASLRACRGDVEEQSRALGNTIEELIATSTGWDRQREGLEEKRAAGPRGQGGPHLAAQAAETPARSSSSSSPSSLPSSLPSSSQARDSGSAGKGGAGRAIAARNASSSEARVITDIADEEADRLLADLFGSAARVQADDEAAALAATEAEELRKAAAGGNGSGAGKANGNGKRRLARAKAATAARKAASNTSGARTSTRAGVGDGKVGGGGSAGGKVGGGGRAGNAASATVCPRCGGLPASVVDERNATLLPKGWKEYRAEENPEAGEEGGHGMAYFYRERPRGGRAGSGERGGGDLVWHPPAGSTDEALRNFQLRGSVLWAACECKASRLWAALGK